LQGADMPSRGREDRLPVAPVAKTEERGNDTRFLRIKTDRSDLKSRPAKALTPLVINTRSRPIHDLEVGNREEARVGDEEKKGV